MLKKIFYKFISFFDFKAKRIKKEEYCSKVIGIARKLQARFIKRKCFHFNHYNAPVGNKHHQVISYIFVRRNYIVQVGYEKFDSVYQTEAYISFDELARIFVSSAMKIVELENKQKNDISHLRLK